jgi:hypothetical protein
VSAIAAVDDINRPSIAAPAIALRLDNKFAIFMGFPFVLAVGVGSVFVE